MPVNWHGGQPVDVSSDECQGGVTPSEFDGQGRSESAGGASDEDRLARERVFRSHVSESDTA